MLLHLDVTVGRNIERCNRFCCSETFVAHLVFNSN